MDPHPLDLNSEEILPTPAAPALEFAMTISINLGKAYFVRPSQYGSERAAVYLLDGTVKGPDINGIVVPNSGGDFPWVRPDGVIDFDARYLLQTDQLGTQTVHRRPA